MFLLFGIDGYGVGHCFRVPVFLIFVEVLSIQIRSYFSCNEQTKDVSAILSSGSALSQVSWLFLRETARPTQATHAKASKSNVLPFRSEQAVVLSRRGDIAEVCDKGVARSGRYL